MTDQEKILKLRQALIAARYEMVYWAGQAILSQKKRRCLETSFAKYDAIIEATETAN